jgi:hypothetical protein
MEQLRRTDISVKNGTLCVSSLDMSNNDVGQESVTHL